MGLKISAWGATVALLLAQGAGAAEPVASQRAQAVDLKPSVPVAPMGAAAPRMQGMRAYIDPVTGELTDAPVTPEQREQEKVLALPAPDYSKVTYETLEDGTVVAHGNGQFESTSTISIDEKGFTRFGCTQTGSHDAHGHAKADPQP